MPERIIRVGIVGGVMQATALLARDRTLDDEERGLGAVPKLEEFEGDRGAPEVLLDLVADELQPALRAEQANVRADDADEVPHDLLDLPPVVLDHDPLLH